MNSLNSLRSSFTSDTEEKMEVVERSRDEECLIDLPNFVDVDPVDWKTRRYTFCYAMGGCDCTTDVDPSSYRCKYRYYKTCCTPLQYRIACAFFSMFTFGTFLSFFTTIGALYLPVSTVVGLVIGVVSGYFAVFSVGIPIYSICYYNQERKK